LPDASDSAEMLRIVGKLESAVSLAN
jgi:hypothetical protein